MGRGYGVLASSLLSSLGRELPAEVKEVKGSKAVVQPLVLESGGGVQTSALE